MKQSTKPSLFDEFMASKLIVNYPCNKHACATGTKPRMITQKSLAYILSHQNNRLTKKSNDRSE